MLKSQFDPILDAEGEVIRPLSMDRRRLPKEFDWLNERGHLLLAKQFTRQAQIGVKIPQPDLRAKSILMRAAYVIGVQLVEGKSEDLLADYLTNAVDPDLRMHAGAPPVGENPFFWTLHLLMSKSGWLTRDQKSKTARALRYAHKHAVPPEFLIGFILQVGNSKASDAATNDAKERWYDRRSVCGWTDRLDETGDKS